MSTSKHRRRGLSGNPRNRRATSACFRRSCKSTRQNDYTSVHCVNFVIDRLGHFRAGRGYSWDECAEGADGCPLLGFLHSRAGTRLSNSNPRSRVTEQSTWPLPPPPSPPPPARCPFQVLHAFYLLVPTITAEGVFKAELLEDFILEMALRSTHLAVKLVW